MTESEAPLVLIVDDGPANRKLARDLLALGGLRTIEAATVAEATALAREHLPDVVLMDLRLPDGDGTDAARALRADQRTSAISIVALTALRVGPGEAWLADAGFDGFITKPIDTDTFAELVHSYCTAARR